MTAQRIGVVGGGLMGSGIAEVCARAGLDVALHEPSEQLAAAAMDRVSASMTKAVQRDKLTSDLREEALSRIEVGAELGAMSDRELIIEAIVEDESAKLALFTRLDRIAPAGAVLATNTSSIPITRLAMATGRPGSVVGLHFFNPAPVMPLVEVIRSPVTEDSTVEAAVSFAVDQLGKTVVHARDRAGFIVNLLLAGYLLDAIRMFESGYASMEDIDAAMVGGASYPLGPFALSDLIGNDTLLAVAESLFEEFREARFAPPPMLRRMVEAGMLGRKTGRGFYSY